MNAAEELARALGGARGRGNKWQACCPVHDDANPSLSITLNKLGKLLVRCHAGCDQQIVLDTLREMGIWPDHNRLAKNTAAGVAKPRSILMPVPSEAGEPDFEKIVGFEPDDTYDYRDERANLLGFIVRKNGDGKKEIRPVTCHRKADGSIDWRCEGFPTPRPLFGLEQLAKYPDMPVLLVEGEKAALAARKHFANYVVLTWCNGAKGVVAADWSVLQGKEVVVWPDADDVGNKAAADVIEHLKGKAKSSSIVRLPDDLPKGWDLADPWPEGLRPEVLVDAANADDSTLAKYAITAAEFAKLDLPKREYIVDPFISTSSLAMIAAERGIGKTWFILDLARSLVQRIAFLAYDVPEIRTVLIFDGEMPQVVIQERLEHLGLSNETRLSIVAAELLFHEEGRTLNINLAEDQQLIFSTLEKLEMDGRRPDLIIFDNISSLGGGIDENDNSALEEQLQFLIKLRHKGFAVLLVHHTGKSGEQRGASRREDLLDTSIKLVKPENSTGGIEGAEFEVHFTKTRGEVPRPPKLTVKLRKDENGTLQFLFEAKHDARPHHNTLLKIYEGAVVDGQWRSFKTQAELVEALGVAKSTVSKHLTKLRKVDLISQGTQTGILITDRGVAMLGRIYGELPGGPPSDKVVEARHKKDSDELAQSF